MSHKYSVCIDPGHGGHASGAVGPNGTKESERTLDVCLRIERLLKPFVNVVMTRRTDVFLTLSERPQISNANNCTLFVSYHYNSGDDPRTALSFEVFTTPGQNNSDPFASAVAEYHQKFFPWQRMRTDMSDGDIDKEANFTVTLGTKCPSILFEGEFLHTLVGEESILNDQHQELRALAVACGVLQTLGIPNTLDSSAPSEPETPVTSDPSSKDKLLEIAAELITLANKI